jgi:protein-L-isoaspartate(D-aspartate) O-methyltransferase
LENKDYLDRKKRRLLDGLVRNQYLKDKRLFNAFLEVQLEDFIPEKFREPLKLYEDIPNLFYYLNPDNYRTISAPHMISIMLQGLALEPEDDLLILGAKSGYIAALAQKLAPKGKMVILEANSDIAKLTKENLEKLRLDSNIEVIIRNPLEGIAERSPWKKILVTGAIKQERIHPLLQQLDPNEGVLYAPVGEEHVQIYTQILRINNEFFGKKQLHVRFTPLMTQVELDELELITDFEEFEIIDDPEKVDETLSKIEIKYSTSLLDEIDLEPKEEEPQEFIPIERPIERLIESRKQSIIERLEEIENLLKKMKKEDEIDSCFRCIEEIEENIGKLKEFRRPSNIQTNRVQKLIDQIRTYNIVRKTLEKEPSSEVINKKIEIINKQIELISKLEDLIKREKIRIESL